MTIPPTARPFSISDATFLARFQMLTIEKPQDNADVGWAEDKADAAARAVKAVNPRIKALRYINAMLDFNRSDANFSLHVPAAAGGCSHGWCCHLDSPRYIALMIIHTKYTEGRLDDSTARGQEATCCQSSTGTWPRTTPARCVGSMFTAYL